MQTLDSNMHPKKGALFSFETKILKNVHLSSAHISILSAIRVPPEKLWEHLEACHHNYQRHHWSDNHVSNISDNHVSNISRT